MKPAHVISLRGLRWPILAVGAVCSALLLVSCASSPDEPEPASETETAVQGTPALPTGGDYHSTALRARGRTGERLDAIQATREQQGREEAEFGTR